MGVWLAQLQILLLLLLFLLCLLHTTRAFVVHTAPRVPQQPTRRTLVLFETNSNDDDAPTKRKRIQPDILDPFPPAADPNYKNTGDITGINDFIVSREGEPTTKELSNENILKIVTIQSTDLQVNTLVWKCLGYRFVDGVWNNQACFPNWRSTYPEPPDLIGMQRVYSPEIDKPSLKANQSLVRSIPMEYKQSLKTVLRPYGFTGYQYSELTPNKTRRAQCANWLLYYRQQLHGYSVEELREKKRRRLQQQQEEEEERRAKESGDSRQQQQEEEKEWKPPVREVF